MTKNITFILPECLPKIANGFTEHPARELTLPNLSKILSRAIQVENDYSSPEAQLFSAFSYSSLKSLPIAAVMALADGLDASQGVWLRVEPVEMRQDQVSIYFMGYQNLQLSTSELTKLFSTLKDFLPSKDQQLLQADCGDLYLQCQQKQFLNPTPIANIIGKDILAFMPDHKLAANWRRTLTETQMILHDHAINQQRRQNRLPLVNSLWFWGEGALPKRDSINWDIVFSNSKLARGLAIHHQIDHIEMLDSFEQQVLELDQDANLLLYDDTLRSYVSHGEINKWQQHLIYLEKYYFASIFKLLQQKKITNLTLIVNDYYYELTAKQSRRWWHKTQKLEQIFVRPTTQTNRK